MKFDYAKRPWYEEPWFLLGLIVFSALAMGMTALGKANTVFIIQQQTIVKGLTLDAKKEMNEKANSNRPRR